jgi:hypothetical protein
MADNVIPIHRSSLKTEASTNLRCLCGSEWFIATVLFNSDMTQINGWAVAGRGEANPRCAECGKEANA